VCHFRLDISYYDSQYYFDIQFFFTYLYFTDKVSLKYPFNIV
jgi:hypothetical protein